jgi:serine/threonine protein kinase
MQATILQDKPLNDRYLIQQVLREEPSERTYVITDINKPASKYLLHEYVASDNSQLVTAQNLFNPELRKLQCLQNPQLESILDFFWEKNSLYIVRHRTEGQNYQDILNTHGTVSEEDITRLLRQVLPLLGILHNQNIIHRNICPSSILFNQQNHEITLINPGIFNEIQNYFSSHPTQVSLSQQIKTLPIGMLPAGAGEDLYTLGITAAILLTGKNIQELFDLSTLSWDWEQWKLTTDQFSQILSRFLNASPGMGFNDATAALRVLNTPVAPAVSAPQIYAPAQNNVYPPQSQYTAQPQYAPQGGPVYQSHNPSPGWKTSVVQDKRLIAIGGGIMVALLGIIAFLLLNPAKNKSNVASVEASANSIGDSSTYSANSATTASSSDPTTMTEAQAVQLVQNWMQAKRRIFAAPFDRTLAMQYTTGQRLHDITKPGGSIDWLRDNNAYYQYGIQKVEPTKFSAYGSEAVLEATITEDRTMYINGKVDASNTKYDVDNMRFKLILTDGSWKITDYE